MHALPSDRHTYYFLESDCCVSSRVRFEVRKVSKNFKTLRDEPNSHKNRISIKIERKNLLTNIKRVKNGAPNMATHTIHEQEAMCESKRWCTRDGRAAVWIKHGCNGLHLSTLLKRSIAFQKDINLLIFNMILRSNPNWIASRYCPIDTLIH